MIRRTRLAAILALGVGLTFAGAALAQTGSGGAAAPAATNQPATSAQPATTAIKPALPTDDANQPVYSVNPPEGSSGVYLPSAVGGYVKSVTGCVVAGCDDGPDASGSGSSSSGSDQPPPPQPATNPGPTNPR